MIKTLLKYMKRQLPVEMIYIMSDGLITQRKVTLYVVTDKEMKGYCHLRRSIRTFKVDRILAVYPCSIKGNNKAFHA